MSGDGKAARLRQPENGTAILRAGTQQLPEQAIGRTGRRPGRHEGRDAGERMRARGPTGRGPERLVSTGIGLMLIRRATVCDRGADAAGERIRITRPPTATRPVAEPGGITRFSGPTALAGGVGAGACAPG